MTLILLAEEILLERFLASPNRELHSLVHKQLIKLLDRWWFWLIDDGMIYIAYRSSTVNASKLVDREYLGQANRRH